MARKESKRKSDEHPIGSMLRGREVVSHFRDHRNILCVNVKCKCGDVTKSSYYLLRTSKRDVFCKKCSMCGRNWKKNIDRLGGSNLEAGDLAKEYTCWQNIQSRCYRASSESYKTCGGIGTEMQTSWIDDFFLFVVEVGRAPSPWHRLARKNRKGDFTKDNMEWRPTNKRKV